VEGAVLEGGGSSEAVWRCSAAEAVVGGVVLIFMKLLSCGEGP